MPQYEIREGNGNDGEWTRGTIAAEDAHHAMRLASRRGMIDPPRDVRITQDTEGDDRFACAVSYACPIFGDSCRWTASASIVDPAAD